MVKICVACGNEAQTDPDYCPICKEFRYVEEAIYNEELDELIPVSEADYLAAKSYADTKDYFNNKSIDDMVDREIDRQREEK